MTKDRSGYNQYPGLNALVNGDDAFDYHAPCVDPAGCDGMLPHRVIYVADNNELAMPVSWCRWFVPQTWENVT